MEPVLSVRVQRRACPCRLHERLREFAQRVNLNRKGASVKLDSFISATPYTELRLIYGEGDWDKDRFAAAHVLFAEDDYCASLFG